MPRPSMLAVLALALPASAGPTGPFPDCSEESFEHCPSELNWSDISWIPEGARDTVRPYERDLGSGVGLDRALRHSAGSFKVVVAVVDSGIEWQNGEAASTVWLNQGELPLPQRADGTEIVDGDLDGDGVHTLADWVEDPRVSITAGVDAADHVLDPSDLIATFSNGVDDDGNGYIDDIAGWDFYEDDNDPYAAYVDGFADHGTSVVRTVGAWADDRGRIGGCPNCAVMPIRIGEAFVTDGDRIALAIAYLADHGVGAAAMALGALTQPGAVEAAARYAEDAGVILVNAGGDENAWHRNRPGSASPFLFVKSIRADNRDERNNAFSFMNTIHCNNFGPRMDLVAPSTSCATGATGKIGGIAGLLRSVSDDLGPPHPSAAQLKAVLRGTATDVVFDEDDAATARTFPAGVGRDSFYGAGRVNAGSAVEALIAGDVPPHARIHSPRWFDWSHDGTAQIVATIQESGGSTPDRWVLEVGMGPDPDSWSQVAAGQGSIDGPLATIELPTPTPSFAPLTESDLFLDRYQQAHQPLVQIRLTVTDTDGRTAEDRTAVWVDPDPDRLPGWPAVLDGSVEAAPNLADLTGDGILEVIVASSSGTVYALDGNAEPLPGFPVHTGRHPWLDADRHGSAPAWQVLPELREGLIGQPAIGDVDGDGRPDIVVGSLAGKVWAWSNQGQLLDGFPVEIQGRPTPWGRGQAWDHAIYGATALADIDGDGRLEIIAGAGDQRLYAWHGDGRLVDGFPVELCSTSCGERGYRVMSSPTLGDIDGDGRLDAVIGTNEVPSGAAGALYAVDLVRAEIKPGYPIGRRGLVNTTLLPVIGEGHSSSPALTDLDGDGRLEIASAPMLGLSDVLTHDGQTALDPSYVYSDFGAGAHFSDGSLIQFVNQPAWADLDGDGIDDYIVGGSGSPYLVSLALVRVQEHQHGVIAFSGADGRTLPHFPMQMDSLSLMTGPAVADLDGDGLPEVIATSSGHLVHAQDIAGRTPEGFPKFHGGWALGGPAVGDITGDGFLDVVVTTREGTVHAWRTNGPADGLVLWPSMRHDPANTGNALTPLAPQEGPRQGCCARGSAAQGMAAILFLPLLGLARRRKR
ncbi:MAG: hypothetical protein EA397_08195 [Deltaproteobacteria bacterium]|nr:MAG: hypothetical protein EA397_08195 [Deltaproteobacteria bacterium]